MKTQLTLLVLLGAFVTMATSAYAQAVRQTQTSQVNLYNPANTGGGTIAIQAPTTFTAYSVSMPNAQGAANTYLTNDGSGNLVWRNDRLLSYSSVSSGTTLDNTNIASVVNVQDNGTAAIASVTLPTSADNGTIVTFGTQDGDGLEINYGAGSPYTITSTSIIRFIRIAGSWKPEV
ncbi:MAG: hypothetical protein JNL32_11520 [Candidatus Kapabacteria bacterium]|nr:hypothetical protein [Candidatus Kapabacteria bacterium]